MSQSKSDIDILVLGTVNAPYARKLGGDELAEAILNLSLAKEAAGPVSSFFYDVPVALQKQFAIAHGLSEAALAQLAAQFTTWSGQPWPGAAAA